ncbi:hydroxyacylglutathione hydrolase [Cognatishimia sp. WU-CL00825]|uniref:hydroxyacylglutathione hydrolase n=1 Tax=Cognatishimia sp. WU-CL00825 TaxID=3127658 RepID=UPI0031067D99
MPIEIVTVPCLSDNYAFLLHDPDTQQTALVDAPDAEAIISELDTRGWTLTHILLTHHHWDHVDGTEALRQKYKPQVFGAKADAHRLPPLDLALSDGQLFSFAGHEFQTIDVSGHTIGHVAFFAPSLNAIFTADSLMALGCGRLFEGSPEQMFSSLSKLAQLPETTIVYSGHEYTESNARFAITVDPDNAALKARISWIEQARAQNKPTVPSELSLELATNPFLRCDTAGVRNAVGLANAPAPDVFTEVRKRKDNF